MKSLRFCITVVLVASTLFGNPFAGWKTYPEHGKALAAFIQASRGKDAPRMEVAARKGIKFYPNDCLWHYNLACALALEDNREEALAELARAVDFGFRDVVKLEEDPDLRSIRGLPRYREILSLAGVSGKQPSASIVLHRLKPKAPALVSVTNTVLNMANGLLMAHFEAASLPLFYDNRDGEHSLARVGNVPNLYSVRWAEEALAVGASIGWPNALFLCGGLGFAPCLANCAMAQEHPIFWRSLPRSLVTLDFAQLPNQVRLFELGTLAFYPAHRDFTSTADWLTANTPYWVASQGSSWSERPFLETAAWVIASLPPSERNALIRRRQLSAAVQMILRASMGGGYLEPRNHRAAFAANSVRRGTALTLAQRFRADDFPSISLEVMRDDVPENGHFSVPLSVSRISRSKRFRDTLAVMVKTHGASRIEWRILQAPPGKVSLKSLSQDGANMEVAVDWHGVFTNEFGQATSRIDIGVFAVSPAGVYSCPAILSFCDIPCERRIYDEAGVLRSIDYRGGGYSDPWFGPAKRWKETFSYASNGALTGCLRQNDSGQSVRYTAHGHRVVKCDRFGRATVAEGVRYVSQMDSKGNSYLAEEPTGVVYRYNYSGPRDFVGSPKVRR